jgi:hypothetical protein
MFGLHVAFLWWDSDAKWSEYNDACRTFAFLARTCRLFYPVAKRCLYERHLRGPERPSIGYLKWFHTDPLIQKQVKRIRFVDTHRVVSLRKVGFSYSGMDPSDPLPMDFLALANLYREHGVEFKHEISIMPASTGTFLNRCLRRFSIFLLIRSLVSLHQDAHCISAIY